MEKVVKILIFFSFHIKTFFKWIINYCLKGNVSISLTYEVSVLHTKENKFKKKLK